ncbi:hypothetical protein ACEYYB_10850 [Paracoccus sp. p4-l81]|uniref:hypothetical protein n=1 Tax=unclassified Paracoccus (in: a-proteobacteria) TaxID=2688777 RepID=UPI0035B77B75
MRFLKLLIIVAVAGLALLGQRFHAYATNTETPFDEVGIEMMRHAPAPARDWACGRLKQTFGEKTLPPHGCGTADGRQWR